MVRILFLTAFLATTSDVGVCPLRLPPLRGYLSQRLAYQPMVEIYTLSSCGYCKALEKLLQARRIAYVTYDIEKSRTAHRRYQELGAGGVPLTKIGTTIVRGFDPALILSAVRQETSH